MKRAVRLGSIDFDMNSMFILEELSTGSKQVSKSYVSSAGHRITYVAKVVTPYITLTSNNHSWISAEKCDILMSLWDNVGAEYELEYDDGSIEIVTFAHDKVMTFKGTHEGSNQFLGIIPLIKIYQEI